MTYRHGFCDKCLELEANASTKASYSHEANLTKTAVTFRDTIPNNY